MSELESSTQVYKGPSHDIRTYVTRRPGEARLPGLVLIHEIWGLNAHIKGVADRLAREGFAVAAPDLMGSDPALAPMFTPDIIEAVVNFMFQLPPGRARDQAAVQEAMAKLPEGDRAKVGSFYSTVWGGRLPYQRFAEEVSLAYDFLKTHNGVDGARIGSLGFCFGGTMSFRLACTGKTQACVVFYGQNPEPIEAVEKIACPVLGNYGGDDMGLNAGLEGLVGAMVRYKKDFAMRIYQGAPHAFFNDTNRFSHRPEAAKQAWEESVMFLRRALGS